MKRTRVFAMLTALVLSMMVQMTPPAHAAASPIFSDVEDTSPYYAGIVYAAEQGITVGIGEGRFSPDTAVTVRQWAVMVCRAYGKDMSEYENSSFGDGCISIGCKEGWLDMNAMLSPDTAMCRGALYESAFLADGIRVYSGELYEDNQETSIYRDYLRTAVENGLCESGAAETQIMSRAEAVHTLYLVQTQEIEVADPDILSQLDIRNTDQVAMNAYLMEIIKVPVSIRQQFAEKQWSYQIDSAHIAKVSEQLGMACAGVTSYQAKAIYVSTHRATIHEFGHVYHSFLGFPREIEELYLQEAESAKGILGDYAAKNSHEYFAETFEFWINTRSEGRDMALFCKAAPQTYQYFVGLEDDGWIA